MKTITIEVPIEDLKELLRIMKEKEFLLTDKLKQVTHSRINLEGQLERYDEQQRIKESQ